TNIIVVTTRSQFHERIKDTLVATYPHVYFLKPFTPTDVFEFLTRWPFGEDRWNKIHTIYTQLSDRPSIRELCTNPLILSMYVAECDGRPEHLEPESRTEFYSTVVDELLVNRRTRQRGAQPGRSVLRAFRERVIGQLALEHLLDVTQSLNSLSWTRAVECLSQTMHVDAAEAEEVLERLSEETGLFTVERRRQTYRFIHVTFCEYLAAVGAVKYEPDGWEQLLDVHRTIVSEFPPQYHARLAEVIPFACGLMHSVARERALEDLQDLDDLHLLARTFLEVKLYDHAIWPRFVAAQVDALRLGSESAWTYEWLLDLHLFNVVVRDAERALAHTGSADTVIDLDTFLHDLIAPHPQQMLRLLSLYAERDAASVFRVSEVAAIDLPADYPEVIINHCDQWPFFELVREQALYERDRVELWAALFAEAALRSRAVAENLYTLGWWQEWNSAAASIAVAERWDSGAILEQSFLTQCMTIAMQSKALPRAAALVRELRSVPAPGRYAGRMSIAVELTLAGLGVSIAALPIPLRSANVISIDLDSLGMLTMWLVFVGLAMYGVYSALRAHRESIAQTYKRLIGLSDAEEPEDGRSGAGIKWTFIPGALRATS